MQITSQRVEAEIIVGDSVELASSQAIDDELVVGGICDVCVGAIAVCRSHIDHDVRQIGLRFVVSFAFHLLRVYLQIRFQVERNERGIFLMFVFNLTRINDPESVARVGVDVENRGDISHRNVVALPIRIGY